MKNWIGRAFGIAIAAALAASGAGAETFSEAECRALDLRIRGEAPGMADLLRGVPTLTPAGNGCRTGALELNTSGSARIVTMIEDVVLGGVGLGAYAETGAPPQAVTLRMDGFRIVPRVGDPVMDFAFEAQSARNGIDGLLSLTVDAAGGRLLLEELSLDFPGPNSVVATAEATGVDASSRNALLASLATARLMSARMEVESRGLFEAYLLMPLAPVILEGASDAEAAFAAWRADLTGRIFETPEAALPTPSKEALAGVIEDLPNPYGRLIVELTYQGGFGLLEAMALGRARFERPEDWLAPPLVADVAYQRETPE